MNDTGRFFGTVLRQFISSLSQKVAQRLQRVDEIVADLTVESEKEGMPYRMFKRDFPLMLQEHMPIIESLAEMSTSDSLQIFRDTLQMMVEVVGVDHLNFFAARVAKFGFYEETNARHRMFLAWMVMGFMSDLIMKMASKFDISEANDAVVDALIALTNNRDGEGMFVAEVLRPWVFVIAEVASSKEGVKEITRMFNAIVDAGRIENAFALIQSVTLKNEGFEELKAKIVETMEKSELNEETISCIGNLVIGCERDKEFIDVVLRLSKNDTVVKMHVTENDANEFINTDILSAGKPEVRALCRALTETDLLKQFVFNHGTITIADGVDGDLVIDGFMKNFFDRADFTLQGRFACFKSVLTRLAFKYFDSFMEKIVSVFIKLDLNDPRMLIMLLVVKEINRLRHPNVEKLNEVFRDLIVQAMATLPHEVEEKHILTSRHDELVNLAINEHTQALELYLAAARNNVFKKHVVPLRQSGDAGSAHRLATLIVEVAASVLTSEQRYQALRQFFALICHPHRSLAQAAHDICVDIVKGNLSRIMAQIVQIFMDHSDGEDVLHVVKLLIVIVDTTPVLDKDVLGKIETVGLTAIISVHPEIRILASALLRKIGERMEAGGLMRIFSDEEKKIEATVRQRIALNQTQLDETDELARYGDNFVNTILDSYFYDMWLIVVAEYFRIVVAKNYKPVLDVVSVHYTGAKRFACCFLVMECVCNEPLLPYVRCPYESSKERVLKVCESKSDIGHILDELVSANRIHDVLNLMQHSNFTMYPSVVLILPYISEEHIDETVRVLAVMLRSPELTDTLIEMMMIPILQFLSVVLTDYTRRNLNETRVITWDKERESVIIENRQIILDYISVIFSVLPSPVSEEDWRLTEREVTFRFLLNWALTESPELAIVREKSKTAIKRMSRVGPVLADALLFDDKVVALLGDFDMHGFPILTHLLKYNAEILIEIYITSTYTQPDSIAECYFGALATMDENYANALYAMSGVCLLGLFVLPLTHQADLDGVVTNRFLKGILSRKGSPCTYRHIAHRIEKEGAEVVLPDVFGYATEAVFSYAFRLLQMKLRIPVYAIAGALIPWVKNLRLLPKQTQCANAVIKQFNYFTPYGFLMKFLEVTESVEDESLGCMAHLWSELMKSPDHKDMAPLFFTSWKKAEIKQGIFSALMKTDPTGIMKRLSQHCSFAYYYYVTKCLERKFEDELWVIPVLLMGLRRYWEEVISFVTPMIHFIYLFRATWTKDIFRYICWHLEVDQSKADTLVTRLCAKLDCTEEWGNAALKWLVGGSSTRCALDSLSVYNTVRKPAIEPALLAKVILFHIRQSPESAPELMIEALNFLAETFVGNEIFAAEFLTCFVDSVVYVRTSPKLVLRVLSSTVTRSRAWLILIPLVKPMIPQLEANAGVARVFDLFIRTFRNEELMLIVAPHKKVNSALFPASLPFNDLMKSVSEAAMVKCLVHYARMMNTASALLANEIFSVATMILNRVGSHENNRTYLVRLYVFALEMTTKCPNAMVFLTALLRREPNVARAVHDMTDYERSLEDVERGLEKLAKVADSSGTVTTDCRSYVNVIGFPELKVKPKILPFISHQEIIEGMTRMNEVANLCVPSVKRNSSGFGPSPTQSAVRSLVMGMTKLQNSLENDVSVMMHPKELLPEMGPIDTFAVKLVLKSTEFVAM